MIDLTYDLQVLPVKDEQKDLTKIQGGCCHDAVVAQRRPTILVDGFEFPPQVSLDAFVPPMSVVGVEVYSAAFTPAEFSRPFAPCGTIVLWTGARAGPPPRPR